LRKVDPAKFEGKRCRILEAAGRCFQRAGFRGASIADICTEAGISPGHLYHYFASKEAIIETMTEFALQQAHSQFTRMLEKPDIVQAFLDEIDTGQRRSQERGSTLLIEVLAESTRNPVVAAILHRWSDGLRDLFTQFVREGQERGQVDRHLDAQMTAAILVNAIESAANLSLKDPKFDRKKGAEMMKMLVSRFLKSG
jgi:TetR/AcrR family transcriptional regulator, repressor for uid operon